jgi:hypothetical protein
MAATAFPSMEESPDLTLLNVARLFTRLEHNLLSPGSELRTLRKSELQRLRVAKVGTNQSDPFFEKAMTIAIAIAIPIKPFLRATFQFITPPNLIA